ncbi:MAG: alpha-E domain-containing protein [Anaerolineae bacterium]|nr:alpha-E domain-containing protein [Anaerolineae bacterium]
MLSRVADNMYWVARYLERAEHSARLLEVNLNQNLERSPATISVSWDEILDAMHSPLANTGLTSVYEITRALAFEMKYHASIVAYIEAARENARQVREQLSSEMWEQLNQLYLYAKQTSIDDIWHEPMPFFRNIREGSHLFQGITDSTMSHGEGWQFIQVGRYIERAGLTAQWLNVKMASLNEHIASAEDFQEWVGMLKCCTAFEAYCKVYTTDVRPSRVAEFLLLNREFPRSIGFCIDQIQQALMEISESAGLQKNSRVNRLAGKARATVDFGQIDEIMADGLASFLNGIQEQFLQIHGAIYQTYITYSIESALAS